MVGEDGLGAVEAGHRAEGIHGSQGGPLPPSYHRQRHPVSKHQQQQQQQ